MMKMKKKIYLRVSNLGVQAIEGQGSVIGHKPNKLIQMRRLQRLKMNHLLSMSLLWASSYSLITSSMFRERTSRLDWFTVSLKIKRLWLNPD